MANEKDFITLVTNIGRAKFINASVLGKKVNLTTIKVGDGNGASYTPVETQTDLKNVVWQGAINSMEVDTENPNTIKIDSIIPSSEGGFFIREIGIYDDAGDLIIITKYKETYKPVASNGSVMELLLRTTLILSNLDTIQLKIDPYVTIATQKDILNLDKKIEDFSKKSKIVVTEDPGIERQEGCFYFFITDKQSQNIVDNLKVSPSMGLKIEE